MPREFTDRAREVIQLANANAMRSGSAYIRPEHVLLGLLQEGTGIAAQVLIERGIDCTKVERQIRRIERSARGWRVWSPIRLSEPPDIRTKEIVLFAMEEAGELQNDYVCTEHILLGLLRESDNLVVQVLIQLGLNVEEARAEVLHRLKSTKP
jgi:ATP-dependent Clp protease ATP-binding subunit ClpC